MAQILPSTRSVTYHPVSSTGPFPVGDPAFPVFDETGADLFVTLDGEEVGGWTFSGTMESGFYGAPNTWVNGSISFASPISGELIIDGDRMPRRQAQFREGAGVPARDHNTELNTITAILQEHRRRLDALDRPGGGILSRLLRVRRGKTVSELPDGIASKYLAFDAGENPIGAPAPAVNVSGAVLEFASRLAVMAVMVPAPLVFLRTAGFYASGDRGGALYKRVVSEPEHAGKVQSADGAWWELSEPHPTARMFGARTDSNSSAAFTGLETYAPGRVINLGGATYPVTAKPTGATYIDGAFDDGTTIHIMPASALDHPFANAQPTVLFDNNRLHYWAGPLIIGDAGEIFGSYVEGIAHEYDIDGGATLATSRVEAAQINGGSLSQIVPVFGRNDRLVQHTQGGRLPSGRVLFVHSCYDATQAAPANHPKTHATWSDNFFAAQPTFTQVDVARTYPWGLGYGPMVISGGAAHFFGYRKSGGNSEIVKLSTPDGESYTDAVVMTIPGNFAEAWVEPIGGGWFIMLARNDDGAGGQAVVALSNDANLVTWTAPIASGLPIGANPIEAICEGGNLTVYAFARRGLPIHGLTDVKLFWKASATELRANGGTFPANRRRGRVASSGATHMTGYGYYAQVADGSRLSLHMEGEAPVGSNKAAGSRLVYTTTAKTAVASPNLALSARPAESLTRNLHCIATRASSWPSITTDTNIIDGWRLDPNGGNVAVSVYDLPEQLSRAMPDSPSRMLQINTTGGHAQNIRLHQRHHGAEAIRRLSSRNHAVSTWTYGDFKGPLEVFIAVYTGTGGTGGYVGSATATLRGRPFSQGLTYLTGLIVMPSLVGITLGPGCYADISLRSGSAVAFNGFIRPPKLEVGTVTPYVYGRRDEPDYNAQWLTRLSYPQFAILCQVRENGTPTPDGPLSFGRTMIDRPIITPSSQTALEVGGIGVTAIAADGASQTGCRLKPTLAGGPLPTGQDANVYAVQPINFLLDCE